MACGGAGGCGGGGGGGARGYYKFEVVPPDPSGSGIHWTVHTTSVGPVFTSPPLITNNQPDHNRIVMGAKVSKGAGRIDYYYTDRYEYHRRVMSIATVLCCIFATPLTLLCTIPMANYWREVS